MPNTVAYTPAEAAARLRVPESWLRDKVTAREIPHTRLGKHLRFSAADLAAILLKFSQPVRPSTPGRRAA